jgi:predicted transcriptional regulator
MESNITEDMEEVFSRVKKLKAKELPLRKVPILYEDTSCSVLLDFIVEDKSLVAMVFNHQNEYIGILTMRHLLKLLSKRKSEITEVLSRTHVLSCTTALDLLRSDIPIIKDDDTIEEVAELMEKYNSIFLPRQVDRKSKVEGLIFFEDIIRTLKDRWVGSCLDID